MKWPSRGGAQHVAMPQRVTFYALQPKSKFGLDLRAKVVLRHVPRLELTWRSRVCVASALAGRRKRSSRRQQRSARGCWLRSRSTRNLPARTPSPVLRERDREVSVVAILIPRGDCPLRARAFARPRGRGHAAFQ